jgi:transcriptional regulator with XRE-family HTH domain
MGNINIGTNISKRRKEKGITQEELAGHLGVSKPAVSKWESGQSYPDILLLPELAAYFDVSVDELIGYEPQLEQEEISKLYKRLSNEFAKEPFDQVHAKCQEYLKKYYSCWRFLNQMGLLLINHAGQAGSPDKSNEILKEALEIFIRVEKESKDIHQAKQAVQFQAICYLSMNRPAEVIDLLENFDEPMMPSSAILVKAYQMKGDMEKAAELLQGSLYINLMNMLGSCPDFLQVYAGNPEKMETCYQIFLRLGEIFDVEPMHPYSILGIHLSAAHVYTAQGRTELAIKALEDYTDLLRKINKEEIILKGNKFFDVLDRYLSSIDVDTHAPRNGDTIFKDLVSAVISNPAFAALEAEEGFQRLKKRLMF